MSAKRHSGSLRFLEESPTQRVLQFVGSLLQGKIAARVEREWICRFQIKARIWQNDLNGWTPNSCVSDREGEIEM